MNSNIRYKFTDSPILAVSIAEIDENLVVLVATVSSIHQLKFSNPHRIHKTHDETQSFSVFHEASTQTSRDPSASLFYVIGHAATPSKAAGRNCLRLECIFMCCFRSSDTAYGRLHIERNRQRSIFRTCLSE